MTVRAISVDELDGFQINEDTGQLYWRGKAVVMESRLRLGGFQAWVAGITASIVAAESALRILGLLH